MYLPSSTLFSSRGLTLFSIYIFSCIFLIYNIWRTVKSHAMLYIDSIFVLQHMKVHLSVWVDLLMRCGRNECPFNKR